MPAFTYPLARASTKRARKFGSISRVRFQNGPAARMDPYAAYRDYVAFWKFNETDPSADILDSSTNALHIPTFNFPDTTAGKVGTAREFLLASTQYALKPNTALLKRNGKTWSINFWFYLTGGGMYQILVAKDNGGAQREFAIAVSDLNQIYANFNSDFQVLLGPALLLFTWYHVQVDFTTGTKACNLYLNGTLEDSATYGSELNNTTAEWTFASYASGGSTYLDGRLDNCYLFDKVVDPAVFYNSGAGLDLTTV